MAYVGLAKKYTTLVEEDPSTGELFIGLPDELMEQLQWEEDDKVTWIENPNGSWSLSKAEE